MEIKCSKIPMWLHHCKAVSGLPLSSFFLLTEIISHDLRIEPEQNEFFSIKTGVCYKSTAEYLAAIINVKIRTLKKKTLPSIKYYVSYKRDGSVMTFRVDWEKIWELYVKNARKIPFHDGGLAGIPKNFTGKIKPTPYRTISIKNGEIVPAKNI